MASILKRSSVSGPYFTFLTSWPKETYLSPAQVPSREHSLFFLLSTASPSSSGIFSLSQAFLWPLHSVERHYSPSSLAILTVELSCSRYSFLTPTSLFFTPTAQFWAQHNSTSWTPPRKSWAYFMSNTFRHGIQIRPVFLNEALNQYPSNIEIIFHPSSTSQLSPRALSLSRVIMNLFIFLSSVRAVVAAVVVRGGFHNSSRTATAVIFA